MVNRKEEISTKLGISLKTKFLFNEFDIVFTSFIPLSPLQGSSLLTGRISEETSG